MSNCSRVVAPCLLVHHCKDGIFTCLLISLAHKEVIHRDPWDFSFLAARAFFLGVRHIPPPSSDAMPTPRSEWGVGSLMFFSLFLRDLLWVSHASGFSTFFSFFLSDHLVAQALFVFCFLLTASFFNNTVCLVFSFYAERHQCPFRPYERPKLPLLVPRLQKPDSLRTHNRSIYMPCSSRSHILSFVTLSSM